MSEAEAVDDERHTVVKHIEDNRDELTAWKFTMPLDDWLTAIQHYAIQMDEQHEQRWRDVTEGDVVFFHSTQSAKIDELDQFQHGIIGVGIVGGHEQKSEPWWSDEVDGDARYPYLVTFEQIFLGNDLSNVDIEIPVYEKSLDTLDSELLSLTDGILDYGWVDNQSQNIHGRQFPAQGSLISIGGRDHDLSMDFALKLAKEMAPRLVETQHDPLTVDTAETDLSPTAEAVMDDLERQLKKKKQAVLYGPPGTGKTYTAKQFADRWVDFGARDTQVQTVTFHPSFSYEDFIEGLTTNATDDGVTYDVEPGIFRRTVAEAKEAYKIAKDSGDTPPKYVLIVDEINRGNLAQIFGEAITLLEADKRMGGRNETDVRLSHSDEPFVVPPNLYLVGTMNTADQSISLVDTALRRRFRFIQFPPDYELLYRETGFESLDDVRTTVANGGGSKDRLLAVSILALRELNDKIIDAPNLGKGKQIGHTNLLNLDNAQEIQDAWRFDILPLLEEYYFGQFDRLRRDLFEDGGDELIDWDRETIRRFDIEELFDALLQLADVDEGVEEFDGDTSADGGTASSRRNWTEEEYLDQAAERLSSDEEYQALTDVYEFMRGLGDTHFGSGQSGTAMMCHDTVHPSIGLFRLSTDGEIDFRWGWLKDNDSTIALPTEAIQSLSDELLTFDGATAAHYDSLDAEAIDNIPLISLVEDDDRERFKQLLRDFVAECEAAASE